MEHSLSRILIETTVRQTLKGLQGDTKRSTRNLVDLGLQFSRGRGQCRFFTAVQEALRQENSPYYALVQDVVGHVDPEHLVTLGMNVGYNSCTLGVERIREKEKRLGYHIPWALQLQLDPSVDQTRRAQYHQVMEEGETLGIYTWGLMVQGDPMPLLPLLERHRDSACFLFCAPEHVTDAFVESVAGMYHLMPVVRLGAGTGAACARLRRRKLPYSVYACYTSGDPRPIASGRWFHQAQQLHPIFTVLAAQPDCPVSARRQVYQAVCTARREQRYVTVPWELDWDTRGMDAAISPGGRGAAFDCQGVLHTLDGQRDPGCGNLFEDGLARVLAQAEGRRGMKKDRTAEECGTA